MSLLSPEEREGFVQRTMAAFEQAVQEESDKRGLMLSAEERAVCFSFFLHGQSCGLDRAKEAMKIAHSGVIDDR